MGSSINPYYFSDCPPSGNDSYYNCHFGGTSAACPIVAGVASLLLSRDSMLTAHEVYDILEHSAVHIGTPVPNDTFGFGRIDAFRAVLSISHGDASNDGVINIVDLYAILDYLLGYIILYPSVRLGDCDCDGVVDISDLVWIIDHLSGGPAPVKPCFAF